MAGDVTTASEIAKLERDIRRKADRRAFNDRLTAKLDAIVGRARVGALINAKIAHHTAEKQERVWRFIYLMALLPAELSSRIMADIRRKRKMARMTAALKAGHLDACTDDDLLELGSEWASKPESERDRAWLRESDMLVAALKSRMAAA